MRNRNDIAACVHQVQPHGIRADENIHAPGRHACAIGSAAKRAFNHGDAGRDKTEREKSLSTGFKALPGRVVVESPGHDAVRGREHREIERVAGCERQAHHRLPTASRLNLHAVNRQPLQTSVAPADIRVRLCRRLCRQIAYPSSRHEKDCDDNARDDVWPSHEIDFYD